MYNNQILCAQGKAKKEDIDHIEQKFHVKIPAEVREHYLMYNGGYPEKPVFMDKNGEEYIIGWFIPIRRGKGRSGR